ncbi:hydroxymethylbilane synthase [Paenibacillus popilliae]|uniref:Porphobilinogen deaminase n=1 Tax=Paenibacillus popilliae ATCC 14706 TaxID=1212764 RepID=M9M2L5_PAEPP|nr:hydroxymethylbilane synthase [Paenibacillus popilliae]GAC41403.1 porphobilinogen deaminase [Paenibacillus popilliae ATCC 14706]
MRTIIVGTRQSALALTQTGHVISALEALCAREDLPYRFEIRKIVTKGDRILDVALSKVGGKGLFVKEIEQALAEREIDMAVHSMKDMPWQLQKGLMVGAIPKREDPRDGLILKSGSSLDDLPQGAIVGTSSLRRSCQLQALRPDLKIEPLRGNIDTRLRKLESEGLDAIVLAAAGLHRMGWQNRITFYLSVEKCVPAVGQGALGIECRREDEDLRKLLEYYHDVDTARTVQAERTLLGRLNGGCQVPIGAHAVLVGAGGTVRLTGLVGSAEDGTILRETMEGEHPELLGVAVAQRLLDRGADRMLP